MGNAKIAKIAWHPPLMMPLQIAGRVSEASSAVHRPLFSPCEGGSDFA
jgi:hypothetical protein